MIGLDTSTGLGSSTQNEFNYNSVFTKGGWGGRWIDGSQMDWEGGDGLVGTWEGIGGLEMDGDGLGGSQVGSVCREMCTARS